jgi:hypothetical protein
MQLERGRHLNYSDGSPSSGSCDTSQNLHIGFVRGAGPGEIRDSELLGVSLSGGCCNAHPTVTVAAIRVLQWTQL